MFEVAKAIPVNRSIKAIPINISWFLFIVTKILRYDVTYSSKLYISTGANHGLKNPRCIVVSASKRKGGAKENAKSEIQI